MDILHFLSVSLVILLINIERCDSNGSGAPKSQCGSMVPGHEIPAQNSLVPYDVVLEKTSIDPGSQVLVEIKQKGSDTFKGFLIQARTDDEDIIGTFETVDGANKYLSCGNNIQSAVTHSNPGDKDSVKVKWTAPSDFTGSVTFYATVVKNYGIFWVKVPSKPLQVKTSSETDGGFVFPNSSAEPEPESEAEPESESEPEAESEPESESEPEAESESEPEAESEPEPESEYSPSKHSDLYDGCGRQKTCFGFPDKCVSDKSCQLLASWRKDNDEFEWELFSSSGQGSYVALGLSDDKKMGDDLVMSCASATKIEFFRNEGKQPKPLTTFSGVNNYKFSNEDGAVLCKIRTDSKLVAGSNEYDLTSNHFILLAGGTYNGPQQISYHLGTKTSSSDPVSLALISNLSSGSGNLLYQLHGLLMLCAWVGCAGAGKILARYFKNMWKGKQILGKDLWFVFHRGLMSLVVVLSIAAVILILVEAQVEPLKMQNLKINSHPVIGLICVILTLMQPIMATFRPHPGTKNRPLFNIAHWAVGNSAHIFAIVALFLAGSLAKANLVTISWWSWLLLAYIIIHFLVHIVFTFIMAKEERSSHADDTPMTDMNGKKLELESDFNQKQSGSRIKNWILTVYFLAAWIVTIVLITAVFAN